MEYSYNIIQILLSYIVTYLNGYWLVTLTLPRRYAQYRFIIMPAVGFLSSCLFVFCYSSILQISVLNATKLHILITCLLNAAVGIYSHKLYAWKASFLQIRSLFKFLPILFLAFYPVLMFGYDKYFGIINPDMFVILGDNTFLLDHSVTSLKNMPVDINKPGFSAFMGQMPLSARFGANLFSFQFHILFKASIEASISLSIANFMSCMILVSYFFTKVFFLSRRSFAYIISALTQISSCTVLSFVTFYVGQNAAIVAFPLVAAILFLGIRSKHLKLQILSSILATSLFIVYFGIVPFAVFPVVIYALFYLFQKKTSLKKLGLFAGIHLLPLIIIIAVNYDYFSVSLFQWFYLIKTNLKIQFFEGLDDYRYISILLGALTLPVNFSTVFIKQGLNRYIYSNLYIINIIYLVVFFGSMGYWFFRNWRSERAVVLSALLVSAFLSLGRYFIADNNYALFKILAWFQFLFIPFLYLFISEIKAKNVLASQAFWVKQFQLKLSKDESGFAVLCRVPKFSIFSLNWKNWILLICTFLAAFLIGLNLINSNFLLKSSMGLDNRDRMVTAWGISGTRDMEDLKKSIKAIVKKDETIAINMENFIWNTWVSYLLLGNSNYMITNKKLPIFETKLPDPITYKYIDPDGIPRVEPKFETLDADYILTWNTTAIHTDIVEQNPLVKPVWQNKTFRLYKRTDLETYIFVGKGYRKVEFDSKKVKSYYWPNSYRCSDAGGEVYVYANDLNKSYYIKADIFPGTERNFIEVYYDEKLISRHLVHKFARLRIGPLKLKNNVNKLTLKSIDNTYDVCFSGFKVWDEKNSPKMSLVNINEVIENSYQLENVELEGWVNNSTKMVYKFNQKGDRVRLKIFVPGDRGLKFPFFISGKVNNQNFSYIADGPGFDTIYIKLNESTNDFTLQYNNLEEFAEFGQQRSFIVHGIEFR